MHAFSYPEPDNRTDVEKEEDQKWDDFLSSPHPGAIRRMTRQCDLLEKLAAMGCDSVRSFLSQNPSATYYALASSMFRPPIPPIALQRQHALEAVESGGTREYALDLLVRELRHSLPDGWIQRTGEPLHLKTVDAMGTLLGDLRIAGAAQRDRQKAERTWKSLLDLGPPLGWLPDDANDPLLRRAFEIGWPMAGAG
jgi:hypothetical protein